MDASLQVRGQLEIISGGYGRETTPPGNTYYPMASCPDDIEYIEWDQNYTEWKDVSEDDQLTTYYVYSDSNAIKNSISTKVRVRVTDKWHMSVDDSNIMTVEVQSFIESATRFDKRGNPSGAGRSLYAFKPSEDRRGKEFWKAERTSISALVPMGATPSASVYNKFVLAPGEESATSTITFRSIVVGHEAQLFDRTIYTDAIRMGLRFKNGLPTDLPIPVFIGMTQTEDICENYVDADLEFEPIKVNGAAIHLEWRYDGQDWADDRSIDINVYRDTPIHVPIGHLAPTNHTYDPVHVYWRAKYVPVNSKLKESDWAYGDFEVIYVPAPHMTVPDISDAECSAIQKGELLDRYKSEQCYSEGPGCADQDDLRKELLAQREIDNAECAAMNKKGGK